MKRPETIILDSCNFTDFPPGGTLSFARIMLRAFGDELALAGIVTDDTPCGRWITRSIDGQQYHFFGICRMAPQATRPLIPARLTTYLQLRRSFKKLQELGIRKIFTQTPQFMFCLSRKDWESICFCFAGMGNSVGLSRYPLLRMLGGMYEARLFRALRENADCILAAADHRTIEASILRSNETLAPGSIQQFPTRFDDQIFFPQDRDQCRSRLALSQDRTIIAVNGRLSWVKGWRFIIDSFRLFVQREPSAMLLFIGDGEDRTQIEAENKDLIGHGKLRITGRISPREVSAFLNAADVMMIGSFAEGWSTAMIEALACAKPMVSTDVSGARDMVVPHKNGYILSDRDPGRAASAIEAALKLRAAGEHSLRLSKQYSLSTLRSDLNKLWLQK